MDMNARKLRVGLGTDGPMSGNTLSIIDELGQVAKVHKLMSGDREAMPAKTVVRMATIGGARALHMEDKIGSLEVGKLADIAVISTQSANMVPLYDVYAALVYSAYASDVRHTIVNGKVIMKNRVVLQADEQATINKVNEYAKKIAAFILVMAK
jgi:cytosine/adenosine deaminase-related metal-dependent hydrolase